MARNVPYGRIGDRAPAIGLSPSRSEIEDVWGAKGAMFAYQSSRGGKGVAVGRIMPQISGAAESKDPDIFSNHASLARLLQPKSKSMQFPAYQILLDLALRREATKF